MNNTLFYTSAMQGSLQTSNSGHQRKRSFSGVNESRPKFDPTKAPSLPILSGDLILQVYTHKSLRQPGVSPEHYGDNERLGCVGKPAFEMELTRYLFKKRPMLKAEDLATQRTLLHSRGMLLDWVQHYGFMKRLRASPEVTSKLDAEKDGIAVFYAYVGALFTSSGPEATHSWIDCLLSQEALIQPETAIKPDLSPMPPIHPQKRVKSETMSPPPSSSSWRIPAAPIVGPTSLSSRPAAHFTAQPSPSPSAFKPLPSRNAKPTLPNPLAPAQPQAAFLPLFNQAATKRKVTVEYLAEFSGLKHAGNWTVKCIVNGICKGEGSSSHKQTAKEEAARNAYYSMGWQ
ncbi:hypothetical protein CPB83DRAFT_855615 [Crepidotus variabilis]|uniref:DRBM domain-containing protein n=1 Tax=Crepidotus variabilis TaxID=179855 RepID=A0A9P6EET8_9AGAR|nr:hypothetical protein CPB83DRAFT_855615 [Crepidotus variabilis]